MCITSEREITRTRITICVSYFSMKRPYITPGFGVTPGIGMRGNQSYGNEILTGASGHEFIPFLFGTETKVIQNHIARVSKI